MKRFTLFVIFLWVQISFLHAEGDITIKWEAGEGAVAYQLEISKDGVLFHNSRMDETQISMDLAPGNYLYRVSFINKFDKIFTQSDWVSLVVKKNLKPFLLSLNPPEAYFGRGRQRIEADTSDVMEEAVILLEGNGESIELEYEREDATKLTLIIDGETIAPGTYDLRIINPSGQETVMKQAVKMKEDLSPKIDSISPNEAFLGEQIPHVTVTGADFEDTVIVYIEKNGKKLREIPVASNTEEELILWLDLADLKKGSYDIIFINRAHSSTLVEEAFTIIDPVEVRDPVYYENVRWGTDLMIAFPLADALYEQSLTQLTFANGKYFGYLPEAEFVLRIDLSYTTPVLKFFGIQSRIAFLPNFDSMEEIYFLTLQGGLYGRTRFDWPFNFIAEADMGYRTMNFEEEGENEGLVMSLGGGILFNYDQFLLEIFGRYDYWLISNEKSDDFSEVELIQFGTRLGYRF